MMPAPLLRAGDREPRPLLWPALFALLLSSDAPSPAAVIYVGSDDACGTDTIEAAVALAAGTVADDEIRLNYADKAYLLDSTLHLTDWDSSVHGALTIRGGFADCLDPIGGGATSHVSAASGGSTIELDTTGVHASYLTLVSVEVTGGGTPRGILAQGGAVLKLYDSGAYDFFESGIVADSGATVEIYGGGVAGCHDSGILVQGGASVYLDRFSGSLVNVTAGTGGGIRCLGSGSSVEIDGYLQNNDALRGGGLHAGSGCEVKLGPTASFHDNRAGEGGGGIYVDGGATVEEIDGGALFDLNWAVQRGGGLWASGGATQVSLAGPRFEQNYAYLGAAAVFVDDGAAVAVDADPTCPGPESYCTATFIANFLGAGARESSVATVLSSGHLTVRRAEVYDNEVGEAEPYGSVFHVADADSRLETESVYLARNRGSDVLFRLQAGGELQVAFTTTRANTYGNPAPTSAAPVSADGAGTVAHLFSSIFDEAAAFASSGGSTVAGHCLHVSTAAGLDVADLVTVGDPAFFFDAEPKISSPVVDYCDASSYDPQVSDLFGHPRGHDTVTNADGAPGIEGGLQDIGAFELADFFVDGFESGDSSGWSNP